MTPAELFETVEHSLLDCPRQKLHIIGTDGTVYAAAEAYEADWEYFIIIEPKEEQ